MREKIEKQANLIQQAKAEVTRERDEEEIKFLDKILHMPFFEFCLQVKERSQSLKSKYTGGFRR